MAVLISQEDLLAILAGSVDQNKLSAALASQHSDDERSQNAKNWLSWVQCQSQLKAVSFKVPAGILPAHLDGELTDVKVQSKGPDDVVYDRNPKFRQRVARGNCVLEIQNKHTIEQSADCVIFALKKFTGGLGDDDDRDIGDGFKWQKYFSKPIVAAERVICTKKMNGEAAHFAVRWMEDDFFIIAGSKNVHLLFRTKEDIEKYSEPRFLVARDVAQTCFDFFQALDAQLRWSLFSFFHHTKYTAVLEILLPHYQHIENLSHFAVPQLYFISWSRTDLGLGYEEEICLAPDFGQKIAEKFGMKVTGYDMVLHRDLAEKLLEIRRGYSYEGDVLYFVDKDGEVIGLLKKKTVWYIIVRAIREKAKNAAAPCRKETGGKFKLDDAVTRTRKRLIEIKRWLGLDDASAKAWDTLAVGFLKWLSAGLGSGKIDSKRLYSLYPVVWTSYLTETGATDHIGLETLTTLDDPDQEQPDGVENSDTPSE